MLPCTKHASSSIKTCFYMRASREWKEHSVEMNADVLMLVCVVSHVALSVRCAEVIH